MRLHNILKEATMKLPDERFQHLLTPAVRKLDQVVQAAGYEIRIVGGAVRDLVMDKDPKDIDMSTDADPETMMKLLDQAGIRYEPTGLQHGTITAVLDGEPIEITTLRIDRETDGRHAEVEFTSDWRADAERRDLTFNAMSMELDGTLHDYFGGVDDIKNGTARFVGDATKRIEEDRLRILRYFRFQGRITSPKWDPKTLETIRKTADGLKDISGERIWMEVSKILTRPLTRTRVMERMMETGVLEVIGLPGNRLHALKQVSGDDPVTALAAMLNNLGDLTSVKNNWKISNDEYYQAKFIIENRDRDLSEQDLRNMLADPKVTNQYVLEMIRSLGDHQMADRLGRWTPPVFPVSGNDLIAAGHKPGPDIGRTLAKLRNTWEESGFEMTRDQLLQTLEN